MAPNFLLGDCLSRLSNACRIKTKKTEVRYSAVTVRFLTFLYEEGFISSFILKNRSIFVFLKYKGGKSILPAFKVVSKPSCRVYYSQRLLQKYYSMYSTTIISTPEGFVSHSTAILKNSGGEVVAYF